MIVKLLDYIIGSLKQMTTLATTTTTIATTIEPISKEKTLSNTLNQPYLVLPIYLRSDFTVTFFQSVLILLVLSLATLAAYLLAFSMCYCTSF